MTQYVMDDEEGPSRCKRSRETTKYSLGDIEIDKDLFGFLGLGDEINLDMNYVDTEVSTNQIIIPKTPILHSKSSPPSLSLPRGLDEYEYQPSTSGEKNTSVEDTAIQSNAPCELKTIHFQKQNEFRGMPKGENPLDFFNFFFSEDFLEMICRETNNHSKKIFQQQVRKQSAWKELTVPELRTFLCLVFHMGTVQIKRIQDYWKANTFLSIPVFGDQMTRNRFLVIMRCLHFTSNTGNQDSMTTIRQVIDYFNNKMSDCYYPAKELTIDENMVLWGGRLKFPQYIKNKLHRNGVQLYMLTEPDGLVLKIHVYTGTQHIAGSDDAGRIVMRLLEGKLNNGHCIYIDTFYSSFYLAKTLLENNTYSTGILCKHLNSVVAQSLKKRQSISWFQDGVHFGMWQDEKPVTYLTTQYQHKLVPVKTKSGNIIEKPEALAIYNEFMSGIERKEQLLAYYPLERNIFRWYLKIALHIFHLLFINSQIIYNKYSGRQKMTMYDFRLSVINSLMPLPQIRPKPEPVTVHKITKIINRNAKGHIKRLQCRQCSKKNKRQKTVWQCLACTGRPGLCVECFELFHEHIK